MCEAGNSNGFFFRKSFPAIRCGERSMRTAAEQSADLAAGTPVVAGGLDAACGTLGAGVIHPGETQEQGGQAGGMSICMDAYKARPAIDPGISCSAGTVAPSGRHHRRRRCYALV